MSTDARKNGDGIPTLDQCFQAKLIQQNQVVEVSKPPRNITEEVVNNER